MKKIVALFVIAALLLTSAFASASSDIHSTSLGEPYPVFIGVRWGDDIEKVQETIGPAKKMQISEIEYLTYENVPFGGTTAYNCFLYFYENKLVSIMFLFAFESQYFYDALVSEFTNEYGAPETPDEYRHVWELDSGESIKISTEANLEMIKLTFSD